jgi:hypothetical protein
MTANLIDFVCVRIEHRPRALSDRPCLTIHFGGWAYCPQSSNDGHEWHRIAPSSRDELARWARNISDRRDNFERR